MNFFKEGSAKVIAEEFKGAVFSAFQFAESKGMNDDKQARDLILNLTLSKILKDLAEQVMSTREFARCIDFDELANLYKDVIDECIHIRDERLE